MKGKSREMFTELVPRMKPRRKNVFKYVSCFVDPELGFTGWRFWRKLSQ